MKQNTAISKQFTKPTVYIRTTSGTIFSADVLISGGQVIFQYNPGAPLDAFASKNFRKGATKYKECVI